MNEMSTSIDIQGLEEIAARAAQPALDGGLVELSYKTQQLTDLPQIEAARAAGLLASWEELLHADPTGTLFQGPVWSLEWYRIYYERYQPCMLVVTYGSALVGLVPL